MRRVSVQADEASTGYMIKVLVKQQDHVHI